jgi:hypothetical protein
MEGLQLHLIQALLELPLHPLILGVILLYLEHALQLFQQEEVMELIQDLELLLLELLEDPVAEENGHLVQVVPEEQEIHLLHLQL